MGFGWWNLITTQHFYTFKPSSDYLNSINYVFAWVAHQNYSRQKLIRFLVISRAGVWTGLKKQCAFQLGEDAISKRWRQIFGCHSECRWSSYRSCSYYNHKWVFSSNKLDSSPTIFGDGQIPRTYVRNVALYNEKLRNLTHKNVQFAWSHSSQKATNNRNSSIIFWSAVANYSWNKQLTIRNWFMYSLRKSSYSLCIKSIVTDWTKVQSDWKRIIGNCLCLWKVLLSYICKIGWSFTTVRIPFPVH